MKFPPRTSALVAAIMTLAFLGTQQYNSCARAFLIGAPLSSSGSGSAIMRTVRSSSARRFEAQCTTNLATRGLRERAGAVTALAMVSSTFGEKINTDEIMLDKTAREALAERYPEALAENPGFLEEVGHGETRTFTEEQLRRRLEVAHVFVNLANLVILSRGANVLAEDFKYYSPATGRLDRDAFLRLTKTLDVAFSNFKVYPRDFVVYKDGTVSYRRTYRAVHDGYLIIGDKTYPPSNTKVVSDIDLCIVSFDDDGIVKSHAFGLMVELVKAVENPEAVAKVEELKKRIVTQEAKLESLEGQESSIAYSKCKADIGVMRMDIETLTDKVNSAPNTEGLGGIAGLFAAVGAELPKDVESLLGSPAYGDVEGGLVASFSFPSEVKDYGVFDDEAFSELSGRKARPL